MASEASDAASRALEGFGDARSIERVGSMGSFGSAAGSPEEGMSEVSVPGSAVRASPSRASGGCGAPHVHCHSHAPDTNLFE